MSLILAETVQESLMKRTIEDLKVRSILSGKTLQGKLSFNHIVKVDNFCKEVGKQTGTRLTVILADGTVLGDSLEQPANMDNHNNRPEVAKALSGDVGSSQRFSTTLSERQLYVAIPHIEEGSIVGTIRTSISLSQIDETLARIHWQVGGVAFLVALVLAAVSLLVSRRLSKPIEHLRKTARAFARGAFQYPLPAAGSREIRDLCLAMHDMADQINGHISEIANQVNEREAIFMSMEEGVIAVDLDERIIRINESTERMFEIANERAIGKFIQEATRRSELHEIIQTVLSDTVHIEDELELPGRQARTIQVHASPLYDANKSMIGALLVLNDITRIKHLESIRREFVANVSHELKTPITAIKGGAETLLNGAMEDELSAKNFLGIIIRQSNRLHSIIEDLLTLSRIEGGNAEPVLEEADLGSTIDTALATCRHLSEAKEVTVTVQMNRPIMGSYITPLFEQAVVNLLANAIHYSAPQSTVTITAARNDESVTLSVIDQGEGIPSELQSRVFERFYRIDKARSRDKGGTGLGLSIVKHIVQIHRGTITLESAPGKGSTFTITIPVMS